MAEVINLFDKAPITEVNGVFAGPEANVDNMIAALTEAKNELDHLIVIGSSGDGKFYFASSGGDTRQIVYDLETAKQITMSAALQHRFYDDEED